MAVHCRKIRNQPSTEARLEIKHGVLQLGPTDAIMPGFLSFTQDSFFVTADGRIRASRNALQKFMQVTPTTFTGKIRIVCRRNQAHSLRCSSKHVTDSVCKVLEFIGLESDLVMNDEVMCGLCRSLKSAMCCKDDIEQK
jgi:hypothetical protein